MVYYVKLQLTFKLKPEAYLYKTPPSRVSHLTFGDDLHSVPFCASNIFTSRRKLDTALTVESIAVVNISYSYLRSAKVKIGLFVLVVWRKYPMSRLGKALVWWYIFLLHNGAYKRCHGQSRQLRYLPKVGNVFNAMVHHSPMVTSFKPLSSFYYPIHDALISKLWRDSLPGRTRLTNFTLALKESVKVECIAYNNQYNNLLTGCQRCSCTI